MSITSFFDKRLIVAKKVQLGGGSSPVSLTLFSPESKPLPKAIVEWGKERFGPGTLGSHGLLLEFRKWAMKEDSVLPGVGDLWKMINKHIGQNPLSILSAELPSAGNYNVVLFLSVDD